MDFALCVCVCVCVEPRHRIYLGNKSVKIFFWDIQVCPWSSGLYVYTDTFSVPEHLAFSSSPPWDKDLYSASPNEGWCWQAPGSKQREGEVNNRGIWQAVMVWWHWRPRSPQQEGLHAGSSPAQSLPLGEEMAWKSPCLLLSHYPLC